jgi:hypothetical protein
MPVSAVKGYSLNVAMMAAICATAFSMPVSTALETMECPMEYSLIPETFLNS